MTCQNIGKSYEFWPFLAVPHPPKIFSSSLSCSAFPSYYYYSLWNNYHACRKDQIIRLSDVIELSSDTLSFGMGLLDVVGLLMLLDQWYNQKNYSALAGFHRRVASGPVLGPSYEKGQLLDNIFAQLLFGGKIKVWLRPTLFVRWQTSVN